MTVRSRITLQSKKTLETHAHLVCKFKMRQCCIVKRTRYEKTVKIRKTQKLANRTHKRKEKIFQN